MAAQGCDRAGTFSHCLTLFPNVTFILRLCDPWENDQQVSGSCLGERLPHSANIVLFLRI